MRPSSLKKRQNYLEVATELFLEQGFDNTGLDQLIGRCGGSKLTLYNYFGDKRGLLKDVVDNLTQQLHQVLEFTTDHQLSAEAQLRQFARNYITFLYHPKLMGLFRLVMSRSKQDPELVEFFLDRGPRYAQQTLERFIAEQVAEGRLQANDPHLASEQLLGSLRGSRYFEALLTWSEVDTEELEVYADRAVTTFLQGAS